MAHVLIVDDDSVSRLLLKHMLARGNHTVAEAHSVDEALAVLGATSEIDLIVCDYVMPERSGLDLLEALRSTNNDSQIPFVLLTGELRRDDLDDNRVGEVDAYLTKPVSSSELETVVTEQLRGTISEWELPISTVPPTNN